MSKVMPLDVKIHIDGILYDQVKTVDINKGDLVFDTGDNTFGYVDIVHTGGKRVAIRSNWAVEVGVPISRVRKLVPSLINNSLN